jgi:hypothetical protein
MRSSVLASLSISALFCLVTAPAGAQEAPADVPQGNTLSASPPPSTVPAIHAPAAATSSDLADTPAPSKRWYGWQTLTADAASITLIAAGVSSHTDAVALMGVGSLALAPAAIHLGHGNYGAAGGSLAMRVAGVPIAAGIGYGLGTEICSPKSEDRDVPCSAVTANLSLLGAAVFAMVLDSAILGYDRAPKGDDDALDHPRQDSAALHVMPSLSLSHERSMVTLTGDF